MWTHSKESQEKITPRKALGYLKEGNRRFVQNLGIRRDYLKQINLTSQGQYPFATILSCIDSRTSAELIFDQGLGDIFSIRIAGNILNEDILGSMEYACAVIKTKIVVVLGHTNCGAIISACNNLEMGNLTMLLHKIRFAIDAEKTVITQRNGDNSDFVNRVSINNVNHTIAQIRSRSEIIRSMEISGDILITGGMYNVETGKVLFFE